MQIVDEVKQAELIASPVSQQGGVYSVMITALLNNANVVLVGNGTTQHTELDAGDSMDAPGDALELVNVNGTPPGWDITDVVQGSKQFKFLGDHTERMAVGDKISIVGSTGNDGFYTIAAFSFGTGKTTVQVDETIPDATADGDLFHADKVAIFAKG